MSLRSISMLLCALAGATLVHAQPTPPPPPPPPPPPSAETAPAPPAPPASYSSAADPDLEPQVTIVRRGSDTHEEVRVNGELRYIRVTPRFGRPYFLVPRGNGQTFLRSDSLDFGLSTPMWQLFSW